MRRRAFISLLGGAVVWPAVTRAQPSERMRRIGVLMFLAENDPVSKARLATFIEGLQQLGWTVGRNVQIDIRWGAADPARSRKYAAELAATAPDVIFASASESTAALRGCYPYITNCVRRRNRSGRRGIRRKSGSTRRQRHRICFRRIRHGREMARVT